MSTGAYREAALQQPHDFACDLQPGGIEAPPQRAEKLTDTTFGGRKGDMPLRCRSKQHGAGVPGVALEAAEALGDKIVSKTLDALPAHAHLAGDLRYGHGRGRSADDAQQP